MQTYPPGTRIGQYEIASHPMMGGMGVVYFALDHGNDGHPVALKTFRPEFLPDRNARDRFLREGTAWIELGSHPHIVRCYKVEYIDPTAFLVLELIAKEQDMPDASLRSWLIPGHPLPIEQALLFALQIARGMQHATEKIPGFVHRDLKPENILVGADRMPSTNINRLRVTDFGLAAILKKQHGKTQDIGNSEDAKRTQLTHGVVGTPLYMAPEQWTSEPVGVFTDIYAFGCIVYEMITGQYRADGKTIVELQRSHGSGGLRPIQNNLPQDIVTLVTKCLNSNPTLRYSTWNEINDALEVVYRTSSGQSVPAVGTAANLSRNEVVETGWSYNAIGIAYRDIGNINIAANYYEKALSIARQTKNRGVEGAAIGNLGAIYRAQGKLKEAIDSYERALLIARETKDKGAEANALGCLGRVFTETQDEQKSFSYNEQALDLARKVGDRRLELYTLTSLGMAYADCKQDWKMSIYYYEQSLVIAREIGEQRMLGYNLGNLGNTYLQLNAFQKANLLYEQAVAILREVGDMNGMANYSFSLAILCSKQNDLSRALHFAQQAADLWHKIRSPYTARANQLVAELRRMK